MSKKIFQEKQRFNGWEVLALLCFLILGLTYRFVDQNWIHPIEKPLTWLAYTLFLLPLALMLIYLIGLKQSVKITDKSIKVKYGLINKKLFKIKWEDVDDCEILSFRGAARNSGWFMNYDHEKRFSLTGSQGLHLKTKEGDKIFIGTKNFDGMREAVKRLVH